MKMKCTLLALVLVLVACAAEMKTVKLPAPDRQGGKPLMQALALRKTTRQFDAKKPLSDAMLSNLLWAANGFNREDKRTAPTAMNRQGCALFAEGARRPASMIARRLSRLTARPSNSLQLLRARTRSIKRMDQSSEGSAASMPRNDR